MEDGVLFAIAIPKCF